MEVARAKLRMYFGAFILRYLLEVFGAGGFCYWKFLVALID
jgi:hypothetical protein